MPNHIMFDLETLGTSPGCVVLALGAYAFDPAGNDEVHDPDPLRNFYELIDVPDQMQKGLVMEWSTIQWWMKQSEEARLANFNPISWDWLLEGTAERFTSWVKTYGDDVNVWCNGASFDFPILKAAFAKVDHDLPWSFQNERDARTIYRLARVRPGRHATAHTALMDSWAQVHALQRGLAKISVATT